MWNDTVEIAMPDSQLEALMKIDYANKVVVITGAGGGIG